MTHSELDIAVKNGDLEVVKSGCEQGLDADDDEVESGSKGRLLEIAAEAGYVPIAEYLIGRGANPNVRSAYLDGATALMKAANRGHTDMVALLLKYGADVNRTDQQGYTAMEQAVYRYLADRTSDFDRQKYKKIIDMLLGAGADLNIPNWEGDPILHETINHPDQNTHLIPEVVELLVRHGADVNGQAESTPPLHMAAITKQIEVAEILLAHGANPKAHTATGETPLDIALRVQDMEMAELLATTMGTSLEEITSEMQVADFLAKRERAETDSPKKTGPCFIATACYGDFDHPDVVTLRVWRDNHLLSSPIGRFLVSLYYWASPRTAESLGRMPTVASFIRHTALEPIAKKIRRTNSEK